jgi:hypothetical protein
MQKLWQTHSDILLAVCAVILVLIVIMFYVWGTGRIVTGVEQAIRIDKASPGEVEFNLEGAKKILDARGIRP